MVKIFRQDGVNNRNRTEAKSENFDVFSDYKLTNPEPLPCSFPKPILKLCTRAKPVDFFDVGSLSVVSDAFKQEIIAAGADFEFFEIELRKNNGDLFEDRPYYFAHLLKEIDCFDFEKSEYKMWDFISVPTARTASKIVLHEEAVGNSPVFMMTNAYMGLWLASDEFAQRIEATNLRGMIFENLDQVK